MTKGDECRRRADTSSQEMSREAEGGRPMWVAIIVHGRWALQGVLVRLCAQGAERGNALVRVDEWVFYLQ